MSQIAPDIPELEHLPLVVRPFIYTRAVMRATRSGVTLLLGLVTFLVLTATGASAGARFLGAPGSVLGGTIAAVLAIYLFFRAVIPWQARRTIAAVERETDRRVEFRDLIDAQDRFSRGVDAYKERESRADPRRQP